MIAGRRTLPDGERRILSRQACARILAMPQIEEADTVYLYAAVRGEVDVTSIFEELLRRGKRAAFPRVDGSSMAFFYVTGPEDLKKGAFGIPEPAPGCVRANAPLAAVVTPGVAFTRSGIRLGYGGGYYDRFFAAEPGHFKAGICYDFQIVEDKELIPELHDAAMDAVAAPHMLISRT